MRRVWWFPINFNSLFPLIFYRTQISKFLRLIFIKYDRSILVLIWITWIPWFFSLLDTLAHPLIRFLLLYDRIIKYYPLLRFIAYWGFLYIFTITLFRKRYLSLYWTGYRSFLFNNINIFKLSNSILNSNHICMRFLIILIFRKLLSVKDILDNWSLDLLCIIGSLFYLLLCYLNLWSIKRLFFSSVITYRSSFTIFLKYIKNKP